MAMITESLRKLTGPYPTHKGEYCGNYHPILDDYHDKYLSRMRFGKPRDCPAGTSKAMQKRGFYGLYLKEDSPLFDWEQPIETPPELMEPGHEEFYNLNGQPGMAASHFDELPVFDVAVILDGIKRKEGRLFILHPYRRHI